MAAKIISSRLIVYEAAKLQDARIGEDEILMASAAKLVSTEQCYEAVDQGLQLFGGYGYLEEYGVEKVLRDMRVHRILEGTSEIMKVVMARMIGKKS